MVRCRSTPKDMKWSRGLSRVETQEAYAALMRGAHGSARVQDVGGGGTVVVGVFGGRAWPGPGPKLPDWFQKILKRGR